MLGVFNNTFRESFIKHNLNKVKLNKLCKKNFINNL